MGTCVKLLAVEDGVGRYVLPRTVGHLTLLCNLAGYFVGG